MILQTVVIFIRDVATIRGVDLDEELKGEIKDGTA
jgi:hypothetical protein